MKKLIVVAGLMTAFVMATDFTQLTTEELVALRGTVAAEEVSAFQDELQSRLAELSVEERQALMSKSGNKSGTKTQTRTRARNRAMSILNGDSSGAGSMAQSRASGASQGNGGNGGGYGGGNGGGHGNR